MAEKTLHSVCRWTFNPGKGGFVPGDMRPEWGGKFGTVEMIKLVLGITSVHELLFGRAIELAPEDLGLLAAVFPRQATASGPWG